MLHGEGKLEESPIAAATLLDERLWEKVEPPLNI